jgi:hypothetical protein
VPLRVALLVKLLGRGERVRRVSATTIVWNLSREIGCWVLQRGFRIQAFGFEGEGGAACVAAYARGTSAKYFCGGGR